VTDRWARSWRADVNGKQATVYGGTFIFRAVQITRGQNTIRFIYHPFGFPWLVIISWGTLAGVISYFLYMVCIGGEPRHQRLQARCRQISGSKSV